MQTMWFLSARLLTFEQLMLEETDQQLFNKLCNTSVPPSQPASQPEHLTQAFKCKYLITTHLSVLSIVYIADKADDILSVA